MKNKILLILVLCSYCSFVQEPFDRNKILIDMQNANAYFMKKWPDVGKTIITNKERSSSIWTRAVYYEGLMSLYEILPKEEYYKYAFDWAEFHKWGFRYGNEFRNADDYCAAQTYIDLYKLEPESFKLKNTIANMNMLINTPQNDDWSWIDAIQMGMPVLAKLGKLTGEQRYWDKMHAMYLHTRNTEGGNGLFNQNDGLWWRDKDYLPPYKEPNGENCYWSRGNGWVIAALVKVIEELPIKDTRRKLYEKDLKTMAVALLKIQRNDGFWNASLHDPNNFGGMETSGTSLFIYGMAYGVNKGILDKKTYLPIIRKGWDALSKTALQPSGFLGYLQSTGKEPSTGMPLSASKIPDFEDYGLGCFLLAGAEVYKIK